MFKLRNTPEEVSKTRFNTQLELEFFDDNRYIGMSYVDFKTNTVRVSIYDRSVYDMGGTLTEITIIEFPYQERTPYETYAFIKQEYPELFL